MISRIRDCKNISRQSREPQDDIVIYRRSDSNNIQIIFVWTNVSWYPPGQFADKKHQFRQCVRHVGVRRWRVKFDITTHDNAFYCLCRDNDYSPTKSRHNRHKNLLIDKYQWGLSVADKNRHFIHYRSQRRNKFPSQIGLCFYAFSCSWDRAAEPDTSRGGAQINLCYRPRGLLDANRQKFD